MMHTIFIVKSGKLGFLLGVRGIWARKGLIQGLDLNRVFHYFIPCEFAYNDQNLVLIRIDWPTCPNYFECFLLDITGLIIE